MRQANLRFIAANPVVVTMPINPLRGAGTPVATQPPPERGPVYQNVVETFNIHVSGRAQPEIEDNQDAFFTIRDYSIFDAFGPSPGDLERRFYMMEDIFKEIEGIDTFRLDVVDMCLVPDVKIPVKFKVPSFEKISRGHLSKDPHPSFLQKDGCSLQ